MYLIERAIWIKWQVVSLWVDPMSFDSSHLKWIILWHCWILDSDLLTYRDPNVIITKTDAVNQVQNKQIGKKRDKSSIYQWRFDNQKQLIKTDKQVEIQYYVI